LDEENELFLKPVSGINCENKAGFFLSELFNLFHKYNEYILQ